MINIINYKCVQNGIVVNKINPKYSSKLCSTPSCNYVNYHLKHESKWQCPCCKTIHDRDINAAKNIEEETKLLKIVEKIKSTK